MKKSIIIAGIGPGGEQCMTPEVAEAIRQADVIIGYKFYFQFIKHLVRKETECVDTGMKHECERAAMAFDYARQGRRVCIISSGDAGIYGMAPLIYEMNAQRGGDVEIITLPGISAFQKAAALLGAPVGHDFCVISLSDLMTPWMTIEKRILAAAQADFVTAVYNPKSEKRYWQLYRLKEIFLREGRAAGTPVGFVRQAGRDDEQVTMTTLRDFNPEDVDMFTVVIVGNSQSYYADRHFITPRGYYRERSAGCLNLRDGGADSKNGDVGLRDGDVGVGQEIMMQSFRTIAGELSNKDIPLSRKWSLLHAIHTTADFSMEEILYMDENAVPTLYQKAADGLIKMIITDVTMAAAGIRKAALRRYGIEVKCYLTDERTATMAAEKSITRTQAGIRLAVEEFPDALYVFGNAPTALMELCALMRRGVARPVGIVAAPVGFVHVCESKYMVKTFAGTPKLIVEGRKGGSNIAATLVNSILSYDDAQFLRPGRDV